MKALLVYPRAPETYWSFKHALKFIAKKAAFPPLGLLTVAALLPPGWEKKVVDMNVKDLKDKDILWADYVLISAMDIQQKSAHEVIHRCRQLGVKTIAGGPLFTADHESFPEVDHLVLGEAEVTLPRFLRDLERETPARVYQSPDRPDLRNTPGPDWSLINVRNYASLSLQYSRGCPFDCEFCDIVMLNGHTPRTKSSDQLVTELDAINRLGWDGQVFIVDDNFIGNKKKLKEEILPVAIHWMEQHKHPFGLHTQASINLADDDELLDLMVKAGFNAVFVGIESPNEDSLLECNKKQNTNRDLVGAVKKLQQRGFQVQAGFIVGFDNDPASIFESLISFIQRSGIVTAMVGLLNAPRGSRLYQRLKKENRLTQEMSGDNTDCSLNFKPKMDRETLVEGYRRIMATIYKPRQYYARIDTFLKEHRPEVRVKAGLKPIVLLAALRATWSLGIADRGSRHYWKLCFSTFFKRPKSLPLAITLAVYGYHFRKLISKYPVTHARN